MKTLKLYVRGYKYKITKSGKRKSGFVGAAIKWFTFGLYKHVSLIFVRGKERFECESIEGRGVIEPHEPRSEDEFVFDELEVHASWEQIENIWIMFNELVGSGYDYFGIWGFVRRKKRHSLMKWFCSEIVAYLLYKAGIALSRREPYRETPSTVMETKVLLDESGGA